MLCQRVHGFTLHVEELEMTVENDHFRMDSNLSSTSTEQSSYQTVDTVMSHGHVLFLNLLGITQRSCIWSDQDPVAAFFSALTR